MGLPLTIAFLMAFDIEIVSCHCCIEINNQHDIINFIEIELNGVKYETIYS